MDTLSDEGALVVLDLILKKRQHLATDDDDVFMSGDAKIRLEDYEKLDANKDGFISRFLPSTFPHPPPLRCSSVGEHVHRMSCAFVCVRVHCGGRVWGWRRKVLL